MPESIIQVRNLSKIYRIGMQQKAAKTFREAIVETVKAPLRNFRQLRSLTKFNEADTGSSQTDAPPDDVIWALHDVSFDVHQGEVVGIIGRNGAGKSTFLKILSRITEPTSGTVRLRGRVSSLLEVGTGFHSELTGRENIYLNGTILGMRKQEIDRKFDEIVAFSEIEKFLDTPVKRYSSGMYVRLAFAVAAHLEPEILLVDEVLAVGDLQFQKKCLGKMSTVAKEGRTVLFVSHNIPMIDALCQRGILLHEGKIDFDGTAREATEQYIAMNQNLASTPVTERADRQGLGRVLINTIELKADVILTTGRDLSVHVSYTNIDPHVQVSEFGMSIWTENDIRLISISSHYKGGLGDIPQNGEVACHIKKLPLVSGDYFLNFYISSIAGLEDYIVHAVKFRVEDANIYGTGKTVDPTWGAVVVDHAWEILPISEKEPRPPNSKG